MAGSTQFPVKLFASVREALGCAEVTITLAAGASVGDLLEALAKAHPAIERQRGGLSVAVNQEIARADRALVAGDEVALIPPVGGGRA